MTLHRLCIFVVISIIFLPIFGASSFDSFKISYKVISASILVDENDWKVLKCAVVDMVDNVRKKSGFAYEDISFPLRGKLALNGFSRHMRNEVDDDIRLLDASFM